MDRLVAPLTVQESWVLCPWLMADGEAVKDVIAGRTGEGAEALELVATLPPPPQANTRTARSIASQRPEVPVRWTGLSEAAMAPPRSLIDRGVAELTGQAYTR
jgi:hypothetical protein